MRKNGHLLAIDIKNEFNSLPWETINNALKRTQTPMNIREYIMLMLKTRYSSETG